MTDRRLPILDDLRYFSPARTWAVARLAVREALRLRSLALVPVGLVAIVLADLSTRRFNPVFDTAPSLIRTAELVVTLIGLSLAIFLSTFTLPRELASRTIFSLVTKPVSRLEIIAGKTLGIATTLALVLGLLGVAALGYFEIRGLQVSAMASERLQSEAATPLIEPQPTDAPPVGLKMVADRGPFRAAVYRRGDTPLVPVSRPPAWVDSVPVDQRRKTEWHSGAFIHSAHWGFANLPTGPVDEGTARVELDLVVPDAEMIAALAAADTAQGSDALPTDPARWRPEKVNVRVEFRDMQDREPWAAAVPVDTRGRVSFALPPKPSPDAPDYAGQRIWVSVSANNTPPFGVTDGGCRIVLPDGRPVAAVTGVRMTTTTRGSSPHQWIAGLQLMGRVRFNDASDAASDGRGIVAVRTAIPSATDLLPEARAAVIVHNETTGKRLYATYRPERRTTRLIPVDAEVLAGGPVAVYIAAAHPEVELGLADDSIQLLVARRSFALNWLKDLALLWSSFALLGAIGVLASTVAGWHVASMLTAVLFAVANVWPITVQSISRYGFRMTGLVATDVSPVEQFGTSLMRWTFIGLGWLLPDFSRFDAGDLVANGIDVPLGRLFGLPGGAIWYALLFSAAIVLLGYLLFRSREVAR